MLLLILDFGLLIEVALNQQSAIKNSPGAAGYVHSSRGRNRYRPHVQIDSDTDADPESGSQRKPSSFLCLNPRRLMDMLNNRVPIMSNHPIVPLG